MITKYNNGTEFLKDNLEFLQQNFYQNHFLIMDAAEFESFDREHYALKVSNDNLRLCVICLSQYHLMITGSSELTKELVDYIISNNLYYDSILCSDDIGEEFKRVLEEDYHIKLQVKLSMDFLECNSFEKSIDYDEVETAKINDAEELNELTKRFSEELNLGNNLTVERFKEIYPNCRIIKDNGKIIAFARLTRIDDERKTASIGCVYTDPLYRGKHLARKVVLACIEEILINKKYQSINLFVDRKNPISYHLYKSVGFKKVFGQTEYVVIK